MSFIDGGQGKIYAPGYFLAHEECVRKTYEIPQTGATTAENGGKYQKMGMVYPSNDGNAIGILYEDVDVTTGKMPGSVVTAGYVIESRLPAAVESSAKAVLTGIKFVTEPSVTRPEYPTSLTALTVTSSASASDDGKTAISVTGVTLKTGEKYAYKIDTTAPKVVAGQVVDSSWTQVDDFTTEIASTDDKKIAVVALTKAGEAYAYGTATVDVK